MSNLHDDQPATPTEDPLSIILREIRKLGSRLERFEDGIDHPAAPDTDRAPLLPSLALRSDGKVLLAVAHLAGAELAGRERWEGVVLSGTETSEVFERMTDAAEGAAGHAAGRLLWPGNRRENDADEARRDGRG